MRIFLLLALLQFSYLAQAQTVFRPDPVQQQTFDSIRHSYRTTTSDTGRLSSLIVLTDAYFDLSDFQHSLLYNEYKKLLADKLKNSKNPAFSLAGRYGEASYYFCLANVSKKQSNSRQALNYFLHVLNLYTTIGDEMQVAIVLSHIASTYSLMGNYSESLRYSFRALKKKERLKDQGQVSTELNNIGAIYCDIRSYSKALVYLERARAISQSRNDKPSTAIYTGNIGHCYQLLCDSAFENGNLKLSEELQNKALGYYSLALGMSEEVGDLDNAAICLENIGIIYSNIYHYKEALPYFLKALEIYKKLDLTAERSYCFVMVGTAYQGLGQTKKAQTYYEQALELAKETRSNYYLMEANLGNSEFYEKIKQPAKAMMYYKKYVANKDSIFNSESTKALARTELNYEFEKKEAAIKFENDKMVYQLESGNKLHRQWRWFFIVVIALALVVLFFVKRAYDNKKKLALLLEAEDQRKDVLLQEVHHRINNNLQIISSLLTLQANNADNDKLNEYLIQSQNRIQSLSAMHELLYDTNSPLHINMKDYISKVLDFHRDVAASLTALVTIGEEVEPVSFPTKLAVPVALILNELVTNSLKYAFTKSKEGLVKISLQKQTGNTWCLTVSDNGKGLPPEGGGRKDSLGLKLVNIMTRQIKGSLTSKSENGAFFSLIFDLPISKQVG
jgi:two-component sensor histidine kinase/Tfp pilus assembly protein PilF